MEAGHMNVQKAYNAWAAQYDTNDNKTRDLEGLALQAVLKNFSVDACLEIGCGTGKNTAWLMTKAAHVTAVDLSEEMLAKAKQKISAPQVVFQQADITRDWNFAGGPFSLVTFSLVLEHIENLEAVFQKTAAVTAPGAYVYIGELHPFKQYTGSKARFETEAGVQVVTCFNHHLTDFTGAAKKHGFALLDVEEWFDENDKTTIPRILTLLMQKK